MSGVGAGGLSATVAGPVEDASVASGAVGVGSTGIAAFAGTGVGSVGGAGVGAGVVVGAVSSVVCWAAAAGVAGVGV